jgi:hypothetical protein
MAEPSDIAGGLGIAKSRGRVAGPVPRPLGPVFRPGPVRDALGLIRLLWAVESASGGGTGEGDFDAHLRQMNLLTETGRTLVECLGMGHHHRDRPETLGYRAAVNRSEEAMVKLAEAPWGDVAGHLVRLARDRVCGAVAAKETDRDAKRKVREGRG